MVVGWGGGMGFDVASRLEESIDHQGVQEVVEDEEEEREVQESRGWPDEAPPLQQHFHHFREDVEPRPGMLQSG